MARSPIQNLQKDSGFKKDRMTDFIELKKKVTNKVNRHVQFNYPAISERDTFSREVVVKIVVDVVFEILANQKDKK
jgi:hypothetical protein